MVSGKNRIVMIAELAGAILTGAGVCRYVTWKLKPNYVMVDVVGADRSRHHVIKKNWDKYPLEYQAGKDMDSFALLLFKKCRLCGLPIPVGIMLGKLP